MSQLNLDHLSLFGPLEAASGLTRTQDADDAGAFGEHLERAGKTDNDRPADRDRAEDRPRAEPREASPAEQGSSRADESPPSREEGDDSTAPDPSQETKASEAGADDAPENETDEETDDQDAVVVDPQVAEPQVADVAVLLPADAAQEGTEKPAECVQAAADAKAAEAKATEAETDARPVAVEAPAELEPQGSPMQGEDEAKTTEGAVGPKESKPADASIAAGDAELSDAQTAAAAAEASALQTPRSGRDAQESRPEAAEKGPLTQTTTAVVGQAEASSADVETSGGEDAKSRRDLRAEAEAVSGRPATASPPAAGDAASTGVEPVAAADAGVGKASAVESPPPAADAESRNTTQTDPVDRARFVQRVARAFESASARGGSMRLRLHPPELGSLRLEMSVQNGVMTARVEAETSAARHLLLDNLPALRERLAEHDIKIQQFDVELGMRSSGGSPQGPGDQQQGFENREGAKTPQGGPAEGAAEPSPPPAGTRPAGPSQFDVTI